MNRNPFAEAEVFESESVEFNIPSGAYTVARKMTLPQGGVYLITASLEFSTSFTQGVNVTLGTSVSSRIATVRGTGTDGGGYSITGILDTRSAVAPSVMNLYVYQNSGTTRGMSTIACRAVRIK